MVKTRNLRSNRTPSRREEEVVNIVSPEHSPQPRETPFVAQTCEDEFGEAMQPLDFFFDHNVYMKQSKFQTRCDQLGVVNYLKSLLGDDQLRWFTEHPQFKHLFHMVGEQNRKVMGMWMLLLRTAKTDTKNQIWFVVNGVPIRYSIREHALLSGLYCEYYPSEYKKKGSMDFVRRWFKTDKVQVQHVVDKLGEMDNDNDRLKMAVLYFLSTVIYGRSKTVGGNIDPFILRVVDDLDFCKIFPWGRFTFDDCVKEVEHLLNRFSGEIRVSWTFPGFILPLELLAFECIPALKTAFRIPVPNAHKSCPKMCKGRYKETSYKGYRLPEIYEKLGDTKVIHSIVPVEGFDRQLMMRCMGELWSDADLREEVDGLDAIVDGWNHILVNERKKIFWENLYNKDLQSRDSQAVHETAPKIAHERAHETAPETTHETASEPVDINEQLRIVLSELVQVKGQLGVVTNKLKTVEEFMEDQRREKRNYREDEDFNWRPPQRGWFETGGSSGSAQVVHERHTPIPEMHTPIPEMLRTPAAPTAPEMDTPAPEKDTTAPEMDTTAPEMDTTAPEKDTPAPEMDTPAPEMDTPAPQPVLQLTARRQRFKQCAVKRAVKPSKFVRTPFTRNERKTKK